MIENGSIQTQAIIQNRDVSANLDLIGTKINIR
jgi:hypothetical protein